jgi:heme exporter protein C
VQRIFYFHVPLAWTAFLAFAVTCLYGLCYLRDRRLEHDQLAQASAEIGMVFTTLVLITGSLWARSTWGTYWTWEPRLTTAFILWLTYSFYLILRRHVESPEKVRLLSSTYGIVAFVNVPIVFMSIRWWRTVHPVLIDREGFKMETPMLVVLGFSLLTFTVLYLLLLNTRTRLARLEHRMASLQNSLMERTR